MAKILLVEDDNNLREIYEARLLAEGYDIVSARDGEEALTVAMKEKPDLIISDVMMPKISGFDMLDIIRSTEETKNAKVIMMTALSQAEDKQRAEKLGADRYLVKSQVTLEDVAKVAREVLSGESTPTPTAVAEPTVAISPTPALTPAPEPAIPVVPAPDEPVVAPVPEPVVEPATAVTPFSDPVIASPVPTPALTPAPEPAIPVVPAPDEPVVAPVPEPASDPAATPISTQATSTVDPISVVTQPVDDPTLTATQEVQAASQSIEDEQSQIAAQIESFIETKRTTEPTAAPEDSTPTATPVPSVVESFSETLPVTPTPDTPTKRVIEPINQPSSTNPDLAALLVKEEEKEKALASLAEQSAVNTNTTATQPVAPNIPHTNGTSIDGLVPAISSPPVATPSIQPPAVNTTDKPDPNAIAL